MFNVTFSSTLSDYMVHVDLFWISISLFFITNFVYATAPNSLSWTTALFHWSAVFLFLWVLLWSLLSVDRCCAPLHQQLLLTSSTLSSPPCYCLLLILVVPFCPWCLLLFLCSFRHFDPLICKDFEEQVGVSLHNSSIAKWFLLSMHMDNMYLIEVHQLTRTMVSPTCLSFGQQWGPPPPPPWVLCHCSSISSPSIHYL